MSLALVLIAPTVMVQMMLVNNIVLMVLVKIKSQFALFVKIVSLKRDNVHRLVMVASLAPILAGGVVLELLMTLRNVV